MLSKALILRIVICTTIGLGLVLSSPAFAESTLNCQTCHSDIYSMWTKGPHAKTQIDVSNELSEERVGQSPYEVVHGEDAENCITCHAPTGILANYGMNESQALGYFFTTENGKFTENTMAKNTEKWTNVSCTVCHDLLNNHPKTKPTLGLFSSESGRYQTMGNASKLCGQCHGNLRFVDIDHLTYNGWTMNKHSNTQADVASELAEEFTGQTAHEVLHGEDAENCIACHAPTAILSNGRMSEEQALNYFFTTKNSKFTSDTVSAHSSDWPSVSCTACHNPHNPKLISYFNSSTEKYEMMKSPDELCGQCHGNLRFSDTDHLSYNILRGTGGVGISDQRTMPGVTCTECHMFASDVDESNSTMFHGHSFAIIVKEEDGKATASCTHCHANIDASKARSIISNLKSSFQTADDLAQKKLADATNLMKGVVNKKLQAKLDEAQKNLTYAEADESGGMHNHKYLMSMLNDASSKADEILSALRK